MRMRNDPGVLQDIGDTLGQLHKGLERTAISGMRTLVERFAGTIFETGGYYESDPLISNSGALWPS
jgi:hypothetical protein